MSLYAHYDLVVDGVKFKEPTSIEFQSYNLTKAGRTTDGTMHLDLVAKKRKLLVYYEVIESTDKKIIEDILDGKNMFMQVQYTQDNVRKSALCYVGELKSKPAIKGKIWKYPDYEFHLIEQ